MPDTAQAAQAKPAETPSKPKSDRYKVRLSHPNEHSKTVFSSVSESRAKAFLEAHYPRGSEAYLETPDGKTYHYEAERAGDKGQDAERWAPFDLEAYRPPEMAEPPGVADWADQEG